MWCQCFQESLHHLIFEISRTIGGILVTNIGLEEGEAGWMIKGEVCRDGLFNMLKENII